MQDIRLKILAQFLNCEQDDITLEHEDTHEYSNGSASYLVLTDDEADDLVKDRILESVWAFRPEFLIDHLNIDGYDRPDTMKSLKVVQEKCCESCNGLLKAALKDEDDFVHSAVSADGRGHFVSSYDGEEIEETIGDDTFYIYRMN